MKDSVSIEIALNVLLRDERLDGETYFLILFDCKSGEIFYLLSLLLESVAEG
jgi:hypothetical protein